MASSLINWVFRKAKVVLIGYRHEIRHANTLGVGGVCNIRYVGDFEILMTDFFIEKVSVGIEYIMILPSTS